MGVLLNLPGVKNNEVDAVFFTNKKLIPKILAEGKAVTGAGYNGAWNIWKDDNGVIRGELVQHFRTLQSKDADDIKVALSWINDWNKFIHRS